MTTADTAGKILLEAPKNPKPPAAETLVQIARDHGVSPLRQLREMVALRVGPGKLTAHDYVASGAFRPEFDMNAKKEFVGRDGSYFLNIAASPKKLCWSAGFVRDKVLYTQLLRSLGIAATETQALVHTSRECGDMPVLRAPADVIDFLVNRARFPVFGKPVAGSGSVGSVLLSGVNAKKGLLHLGNGRDTDLDAFAHEIIADYPEGFVLQTAIDQHEVMSRVIGGAVGTLRVVTLRDGAGISPLYTIWKIPSPKAMSDNFWQDGSMIAEIGPDGKVLHCAQGSGPGYVRIDTHPVSGETFAGLQIPHWDKVHAAAVAAHSVFPEFGVIGWDIGMSQDGPVVIEANDNPFHTLYQLAADRGIRNADFMPRFDAAAAESVRLIKAREDTRAERTKARKA